MVNMKLLMYGWEFPPRISGGLGTACYAIVQELAQRAVDLTLVLPYTLADCSIKNVNFIGCDHVDTSANNHQAKLIGAFDNLKIKYTQLAAGISPYTNTSNSTFCCSNEALKACFEQILHLELPPDIKAIIVDIIKECYLAEQITGGYGVNLLLEVFRYAAVAGALATTTEHDVIYAHDWLTVLAGVEAKRLSNKPLVLHVHALETDRSGIWINQKIYQIEKYGMEQADHIVAVSGYTKDKIVKHYGIDPGKITVVHNGIYCDAGHKQAVKNKLPVPMVLFLGRITHQKGPGFFVEVAHKVLAKKPEVQFVMAGSGDLITEMIEKVASLRMGKNFHFTGFLDGKLVKQMYRLADVYVMPSVSEPFGLSALEALSYNVPAIISRQSGVAEVLHHTLVSDFWDTDDIAGKIMALLEYPALRKTSLAHESKQLQHITWGRAAEKLIDVYKKVA